MADRISIPRRIIALLKQRHIQLLLLFTLAGLLLRVVWLGHASYRIDEINVVFDSVNAKSSWEIYTRELGRVHYWHRLPLLMMIISWAVKIIPYSAGFPPEWIARLPFALLGAATTPLMYLLGKAIRDRAVGLWAAFLTALSVFLVFYSRDAYDYSLVVFFTAGVLWCSIRLMERWGEERALHVGHALGYMFFSVGLIYSHLTSLWFLAAWNLVMGILVIRKGGFKALFTVKSVSGWAITLLLSYLSLLPFIIKLSGGVVKHEEVMVHLKWYMIPMVLGRLGWGESWWALLLFCGFVAIGMGLVSLGRDGKVPAWKVIGFIVAGAIFSGIQTWTIQFGRFEVRYYCQLVPILLIGAALGIVFVSERFAAKLRKDRTKSIYCIIGLVVTALLLPSDILVVGLKMKTYDYKGLAVWINENMPQNGIYCFWNGHYFRGVPRTYPTPGRYPAFTVPWDTRAQYHERQLDRRMVDFFTKFPLACMIERPPEVVLANHAMPDGEIDDRFKIPREKLFARNVWLEDKCLQNLKLLKTWPQEYKKWSSGFADRLSISYNRPEDLPELARKNGRIFYHYFGEQWHYIKDRQMNDWRHVRGTGVIYVGNASSERRVMDVTLVMAGGGQGSSCRIRDGRNGKYLTELVALKPAPERIVLPGVTVEPGVMPLHIESGSLPGNAAVGVLVYSIGGTVH